jgi:hypothetical protein
MAKRSSSSAAAAAAAATAAVAAAAAAAAAVAAAATAAATEYLHRRVIVQADEGAGALRDRLPLLQHFVQALLLRHLHAAVVAVIPRGRGGRGGRR